MSTTRSKSTKQGSQFDGGLSAVYALELASPQGNRFDMVVEAQGPDEEYMLAAFHTQSVAVEGRSAVAQFLTSHVTEMADHAAYKMTEMVEHVNRYQDVAQLGRYQERHYVYTAQLIDSTWRQVYQANEIAARSMFEDVRRPIYRPYQPEQSKRKGMFRGVREFLFGEE